MQKHQTQHTKTKFVDFIYIAVYRFPATFGITPYHHSRTSRVEVAFDLIFSVFWVVASICLSVYEGACPISIFYWSSCSPWYLTMIFGYLSFAAYGVNVYFGIVDLKNHGWGVDDYNGKPVGARGAWLPESELDGDD
jgi:hypothetical protein